MVVVEPEDEAQPVEAFLALGSQQQRAVRQLLRPGPLAAGQQAGQDAASDTPGRVRREPPGERERVGAARLHRPLYGHAATLRASTVGPVPAGGRRALRRSDSVSGRRLDTLAASLRGEVS